MDKKNVVDVTEAEFQQAVLDRSHEVAVVVDFWAPWCGPCRVLGPALEAEAEKRDGQVLLAKVNVDEAQGLAAEFRVSGIPAVKAFRDGRVVAEFVGARPAREVAAFFDRLVPSQADLLTAEAARQFELGRTAEAARLAAAAAESNPQHGGAKLVLARLAAESGKTAEALRLLESLPHELAREPATQQLRAGLKLRAAAEEAGTEPDLSARAAENPADLEARFGLALHAAAAGRVTEALDALLELVRTDRQWRDQAARKSILDVFELVGPRSELAEDYRHRLSLLLY